MTRGSGAAPRPARRPLAPARGFFVSARQSRIGNEAHVVKGAGGARKNPLQPHPDRSQKSMNSTGQAAEGHSTGTDDFHVFDTTLRDGAQREGINLTVA